MKRRSFLSLLGAAGVAPMLPVPAGSAPVAAVYNRYTYGLAVFHARTRASVTAADLVAKLRVSAATAEAMMGEMTTKGVIVPAVQAAGGAMRVLDPHRRARPSPMLRDAARRLSDWIDAPRDHIVDKEADGPAPVPQENGHEEPR